jgi:hypothetical protein
VRVEYSFREIQKTNRKKRRKESNVPEDYISLPSRILYMSDHHERIISLRNIISGSTSTKALYWNAKAKQKNTNTKYIYITHRVFSNTFNNVRSAVGTGCASSAEWFTRHHHKHTEQR